MSGTNDTPATSRPDPVADPDPVPEDDGTQDVPTGMIAGMPWWAALAAALVVLIGFYVTCHAAWGWVTSSSSTHRQGDWLRLSSIIGVVNNVTLIIIGAVFGVAAQGGQTKAAATVAKNNQHAARRHHRTARRNRDKVAQNKQSALHQGELVRMAARELTGTRHELEGLQRSPEVSFARGGGTSLESLLGAQPVTASLVEEHRHAVVHDPADISATEPRLDEINRRLDETAQTLLGQAL